MEPSLLTAVCLTVTFACTVTITSCFALAAHAMVLLAHSGAKGATSDYIAESASTNPARVRRVLAPLVRAGLVSGREGGGGGYVLARAPDAITLGDIFAAAEEGPVLPFHPRAPNTRCPIGSGITAALEQLEDDVGAAVRDVLARRSLRWLAKRVANGAGASAMTSRNNRKRARP